MDSLNGHTPREICHLITKASILKAQLSWTDLILKSFLGDIFISLGGLFDLTILSGAPGLRASNPSLATLIGAFTFPTGFYLIVFTNAELVTSNIFVMTLTALQQKTTIWDLTRNWTISYIFNMAGALAFAGFMAWWTNTFSTPSEQAFVVAQAEARVHIISYWSVNFLRGVGCNWLVGLTAYTSSAASNEHVAKIYSLWIPIWAFAALGYQHCIANYFLVPIGMFYGADVSVGEFIYKSCVPVTLGNLVGGAVFVGAAFWWLYGREEGGVIESSVGKEVEGSYRAGTRSLETLGAAASGTGEIFYEGFPRDNNV